jgi:signal transduction histidine kinase
MSDPPRPTPLGVDRRRDRRVSSARLTLVAIGFVVVALVALTIGPGLTGMALDTLRADTDATSGRAQQLLGQVNQLILEGIVEQQGLRLAASATTLAQYRHVRAAEDTALDELIEVARRAGPATVEHAAALRQLARRWHELADARAEGRLNDGQFVAALPTIAARRDSVFTELHELTDDFRDSAARDQRAGGTLIRRERGVSLTIGVLAILAVISLVWFARHDRRLTRELERALDEEARLRAETEERRKDLERVTESRNRLMRGFTHDVKNPIGAADGFLQLLQDGILEPLSQRQQHAVSRCRSLLASALLLISDLLEVARAESDTIEVHLGPMDAADIAGELVEEYRPLAAQKGLQLSIESALRHCLVQSDPARVHQVLGNLISNAVKYTERGQVTVGICEPEPDHDGDGATRVGIAVRDTGPGIPPEKRELLFQEFVRLDPASAPGAGVGLAMSRRIAHALRGDITVESEPGRGSAFILWLPAVADVGAMSERSGVMT